LKTRNKLLNEIKKLLISKSEVEFAFIFGSFANNEDTGLSDIDIAIYLTKHKSKHETLMLEFEIEAKLTERIPTEKFDVRCLSNAPIVVIGKIINEGKLLFARDENFLTDYIEKNRLKYMDYLIVYKPLLEKRFEDLLDGR